MTLVLIGADTGADQSAKIIRRVPQGVAKREDALRDLLFANPQLLPVDEIDPAIGPLVPIARELNVPGVGRIDAFFADARGHLVVVECKLWRNPQARREVVGQILDYARALAAFSYDDLQREVSRATGRDGNALYELVAAQANALGEARFVDQVSRNLMSGRFLLVVAGDGITEGTRRIGEYLIAQPGLAFSFAMIEIAQYRWISGDGSEHTIIHPRVLAQTTLIERAIIRNEANVTIADVREEEVVPPAAASETSGRKLDPQLLKQWRDFATRFISQARFDDPAQPPPKVGGFGWLRLALPHGFSVTLWRSKLREEAGAFISFADAQKRAVYERLLEDRENIDAEFADAGLAAPTWSQDAQGTSIALTCPAMLPWDLSAEEAQVAQLHAIANQMVSSFRPRLERAGAQK